MYPSILTVDGSYFDFKNPGTSVISIETIAHALSHICRFTGHTKQFYSVAQHSVLVSECVPPELALVGLLHDASEAYLGDVAAPLKMLLPEYKAIELQVEAAIFARFGIEFPFPDEAKALIKQADIKLLVTEKCDLMPEEKGSWYPGLEPLDELITPWSPADARRIFMAKFRELYKE